MHKSKWGEMRKIHGYHHRVNSHSLNALETVQHSYLDGFLQVAVNILVQQISPFGGFGHKHSLSRLAHNVVVTYLLTEAHSGYDLPWMSHRIFPEFLGGSPRHEKHHHDGRVYYQQYFKYLDDFFGFTQEEQVVFRKKIKEPTAAAPTEDSSLVRKEIASIS
jgi:sterol desaturase/sphingolipid hydroxylase (fatty acid hydroxylase superfamily)